MRGLFSSGIEVSGPDASLTRLSSISRNLTISAAMEDIGAALQQSRDFLTLHSFGCLFKRYWLLLENYLSILKLGDGVFVGG